MESSMEYRWMMKTIILLSVCQARELKPGENCNISADSNILIPHNYKTTVNDKVLDFRDQLFEEGSDAALFCTNHTWNKMMYMIWTITMKGRKCCRIGREVHEDVDDDCSDGKALRNTTAGVPYLFIPHFSKKDEGTYSCDTAYVQEGSFPVSINVSAWDPPKLSISIEKNGRIALCVASGGKPVESVAWEANWNSSLVSTHVRKQDGYWSRESRFSLPRDIPVKNLTCLAKHPSWPGLRPVTCAADYVAGGDHRVTWLLIVLCPVCFALAILFGVYVTHQQLCGHGLCCKVSKLQTHISSPTEDKPVEEVEEVEPYASYVQRDNSIYNSSAELFNL